MVAITPVSKKQNPIAPKKGNGVKMAKKCADFVPIILVIAMAF